GPGLESLEGGDLVLKLGDALLLLVDDVQQQQDQGGTLVFRDVGRRQLHVPFYARPRPAPLRNHMVLRRYPVAYAIRAKPTPEATDHPEAVLVLSKNSKNQKTVQGSGVLLAPSAVLTTAHNADGFDAWEVKAPLVKKGVAQSQAKTVKIHPNYKRGAAENDLAVLILEDAIDTGRPFPALYAGDLLRIGTGLRVIGRVRNGTPSASQLFETSVTLVAVPGNSNLYGGNPAITEPGDSG